MTDGLTASNILVQQNCFCESPLICTCPEGNKIYCVLGDMNLLCDEGESSLITSEMWHRMALHEPAGTPRMKAPEVNNVYYINLFNIFVLINDLAVLIVWFFSPIIELVKMIQ